jgi:hypothetical protein
VVPDKAQGNFNWEKWLFLGGLFICKLLFIDGGGGASE